MELFRALQEVATAAQITVPAEVVVPEQHQLTQWEPFLGMVGLVGQPLSPEKRSTSVAVAVAAITMLLQPDQAV